MSFKKRYLDALLSLSIVIFAWVCYLIYEITKGCGAKYVDGPFICVVTYIIILSVPVALGIQLRMEHDGNRLNDWCMLFACANIILLSILFTIETLVLMFDRTALPIHKHTISLIQSNYWRTPIFILCMIRQDPSRQSILTHCPAIMDIYDGIEMLTSRSDETSPVWVQVTFCLAVITFYIPSFLELYHLKYPDGTFLSKRRVNLTQLIASFLFLALRVVVFACNPQEMRFILKSFIRIYYHYKTCSNLRHGQKIILVQSTEISTKEVALLATQKQNLRLYDIYVNDKNGEMQKSDEVRIAIDLNSVWYKRCSTKHRSQSF